MAAGGSLGLPESVKTGQVIDWTVPHDTMGCPRHLWLQDLEMYYDDVTVTPYETTVHLYDEDPGLVANGNRITGTVTLKHSGWRWDPRPSFYVSRVTKLEADFGGMTDVPICAAASGQLIHVER